MINYFKPYEGAGRFVFVSYSHANSETVINRIGLLKDKRYRIWYDEGIPAGNDWPLSVQQHLEKCDTVLFFKSATALKSENCFSEIKNAGILKKKIIRIDLDDSKIDEKWEEVFKCAEISDIDDIESFLDDGLKGEYPVPPPPIPPFIGLLRKILLVLCFALLAAVIYFAVGLFRGKYDSYFIVPNEEPVATVEPTKKPEVYIGDFYQKTISFPADYKECEESVRFALDSIGQSGDIPLEEVQKIDALYICGSMGLKSDERIVFDKEKGIYKANNAQSYGKMTDLSFFSQFSYLETLVVVQSQIKSIGSVKNLQLLSRLDLSGNPIDSLEITGVGAQSSQQYFISLETLNIEHTNIKDLTPLSEFPSLKRVTVSADMRPLVLDENAKYEVILVG